jgi:hypothetical protein
MFYSAPQLIEALMAYIEEHNQDPQAFFWAAKSQEILHNPAVASDAGNDDISVRHCSRQHAVYYQTLVQARMIAGREAHHNLPIYSLNATLIMSR